MVLSISCVPSAVPPAPSLSFIFTTSVVMSSMYDERKLACWPPDFVFQAVRVACCFSEDNPQDLMTATTSPQSCKMAYSPALWYILTHDPAPPLPFITAQGRPSSALAEAASITSLMSSQTLRVPPGKKAGPLRAPSSPPLMPMPRKRKPLASNSSARLV